MNNSHITKENEALLSGLLKKIYDAGGEAALKEFISSKGESFPPMKVSNKELELLKGGKASSILNDFMAGMQSRGISDGKHSGSVAYFIGLGLGNAISGHGHLE